MILFLQAFWLSLFSTSASVARVAGPLLVTEIYAAGGSYWMLGSVTSTLVLALALTIIFYRTLVPPTSKAEPPHTIHARNNLKF